MRKQFKAVTFLKRESKPVQYYRRAKSFDNLHDARSWAGRAFKYCTRVYRVEVYDITRRDIFYLILDRRTDERVYIPVN